MKKLLLISIILVIAGLTVQAQNCACNPNGWNPFTVKVGNGATQTVNCGHQFSVKCRDTITLKGAYKCVGTNCATKYKAVLRNTVTNAIVQNYPSFSFPWVYSFPAAGSYSLEITPICGTAACQPCRFFFTVTCPTTPVCDCGTPGWEMFTAHVANNSPINVKCGHQFGAKRGQPFKLSGKYVCKGSCAAKYVAVLKNNVTNVVVANFNPFNFPWVYTFALPGNYKLEITPMCGNKKCQPCVFYFTITN